MIVLERNIRHQETSDFKKYKELMDTDNTVVIAGVGVREGGGGGYGGMNGDGQRLVLGW